MPPLEPYIPIIFAFLYVLLGVVALSTGPLPKPSTATLTTQQAATMRQYDHETPAALRDERHPLPPLVAALAGPAQSLTSVVAAAHPGVLRLAVGKRSLSFSGPVREILYRPSQRMPGPSRVAASQPVRPDTPYTRPTRFRDL